MIESRTPPHDADAERAVLGAMLRDNACIPDVSPLLRADDFYTDAHRKVYAAVLGLVPAPADLVTLYDALRSRGWLEDAGGAAYLAEVWDGCPSSANAAYYAGIVREHSVLRSLARVAAEVLRDAHAPPGPALELVAAAERSFAALSERRSSDTTTTLAEAVDAVLARVEAAEAARQAGADPGGLMTGLAPLDALLGGLRPGTLTVVAARPSVGKSAVATCLAANMARDGRPVLVASLEMSAEELAVRVLSAESGVEGRFVHAAELDAVGARRLLAARDALRPWPLVFDDAARQSLAHLGAACRRVKRRSGLACVFVDYLQLVEPEDKRANRNAQVGGISRGLKALARELGVPVVALAQLNREAESRPGGKPRLSDLRDSGEIEQDGDAVVLLHRRPDASGMLDFEVAKQRNGPLGEFSVRFDRPRMRLGDEGSVF